MGMDLSEPTPTLNFLHDVSTRIAAADPLHEVLDEIVDFVIDLVSCDSCFIYVKENNDLVLRASKNSHPDVLDSLKIRMGEGITGWVAEVNTPVVLTERASQDPRFQKFSELPEDTYEAFLSIPVSSRGTVVGVINVQHRDPYNFTEREIKIISTLGHLVGAAIERVRLEEEVSDLSGKLAARKLVERAKGVLQRELGISEEEAYSTIQKQARHRRKSMKEISEAILLADEMKRGKQTA
jgi:uroporphyrinogen-III synthase